MRPVTYDAFLGRKNNIFNNVRCIKCIYLSRKINICESVIL